MLSGHNLKPCHEGNMLEARLEDQRKRELEVGYPVGRFELNIIVISCVESYLERISTAF